MRSPSVLSAVLVGLALLAGCQEKSAIEKAQDKVNDALDRRPAEGIRDAAEDVGDAAKEFGSAVKDAAKEVAHDAKEVASDAKDAARDVGESAKQAVKGD